MFFYSIVNSYNGMPYFLIGLVMLISGALMLGANFVDISASKKAYLLSLLSIVVGLFFTLNLACYINPIHPDNRYYLPAEFYGMTKNNTWLFIDEDGNIWEWEDNVKSYNNETVYLLNMDDNTTPDDIHDDVLLMVWAEGGEEISWG